MQVESFTDQNLNRNLVVQPDGTITLRLLGEMRAAGMTIPELRDKIEEAYKKYYKLPSITVTPLKVNTQLDDLRATVDNRAGRGGQGKEVRVTPARHDRSAGLEQHSRPGADARRIEGRNRLPLSARVGHRRDRSHADSYQSRTAIRVRVRRGEHAQSLHAGRARPH